MLQIKNITKSFPDAFAPVLDTISLTLEPGEFCVVIGANGSGKSTLLKLISGEYLADAGEIQVNGLVSQVTQDVSNGTIPAMTLLENIALSQMRQQPPKFAFYRRQQNSIVAKIKQLNIGLEEYINRNLTNLSGGQRQIIATIMAINSGGQVLLLDEHTSALDPKMQTLLMEYTAKTSSDLQLTTMMVTHKIDDAIKYGNRLIMLNKGKIVLDIAAADKRKLQAHELLALFHQYEYQNLLLGERHDN